MFFDPIETKNRLYFSKNTVYFSFFCQQSVIGSKKIKNPTLLCDTRNPTLPRFPVLDNQRSNVVSFSFTASTINFLSMGFRCEEDKVKVNPKFLDSITSWSCPLSKAAQEILGHLGKRGNSLSDVYRPNISRTQLADSSTYLNTQILGIEERYSNVMRQIAHLL